MDRAWKLWVASCVVGLSFHSSVAWGQVDQSVPDTIGLRAPSENSEEVFLPPETPVSLNVESNADISLEMADCETGAPADAEKAAALKKAVATAYAPLFFNNNFSYLCDPAYDGWHLGERWKRLCLGEHSALDIGGQYRARWHREQNFRGFGLTGNDDSFLLHRTRLYMNGELGENLRVYAEMIDAESQDENFAPRAIEVNRADMLNLFADVRLLSIADGELSARIGRQELLYGGQRLVSPLDWSNTRRNFDGVNLMYKSTDWTIDTFLTHPVVVDPHNFDSYDENQDFVGSYGTYKAIPNETVELYYLHYRNANAAQGPNGLYFETTGARWQGSSGCTLWDFEGAYQFGKNRDDSQHNAGFLVGGLGRKLESEWKTTLWAYYDWSSGGTVRGGRQGFDHLFPLGHRYHGFMDLYARSNIETPNLLLTFQPREKLQCLLWYHYFFLENKNDSPYNVNMTAFNAANAPASASLGHEIDTTIQWSISPRTDLLLGYSHFFAGDYYKLTPGLAQRGDADFFYTQFTVNF